MASNFNLRILLDTKLNGSNFSDWFRAVRIVLRSEGIAYVLSEIFPVEPDVEDHVEHDAWLKHRKDRETAMCIMLGSMNSELQKQHENMPLEDMVLHLEELFSERERTERYETSKLLFGTKMQAGTSASQHVLKLLGYLEKLNRLGFEMNHDLSIDLVLMSLTDSYSGFVTNYYINRINSTIPELINMLKILETQIKKD